jgi:ketosteroid isomerase-like protein
MGAMSLESENVEIVRAVFGAIRDRDHRQAAVLFSPAAEWHNTSAFPGPRVCVGPDAIVGFWETLAEDVEGAGGEIERIADVDGRVVVGVHSWGRGRASGAPIDVRWAAVFEVVDQRIVRIDIHGGYEKALAAVGLAE